MSIILFKKYNHVGLAKSFSTLSGKRNRGIVISARKAPNFIYKQDLPPSFWSWLAGLIDGDGHFEISPTGSPRLNISAHRQDAPMLKYLQGVLGGSIYVPKSNKNFLVYYLGSREQMYFLVNGLNGYIRNSVRLPQFIKISNLLNIIPKSPMVLSVDSAYYAGFFDADGSLALTIRSNKNNLPELELNVTNKYKKDLVDWVTFFNGAITAKAGGQAYHWRLANKTSVMGVVNYLKPYSRSYKAARLALVATYYRLKDLKAWKPEVDPILRAEWAVFYQQWQACGILGGEEVSEEENQPVDQD